MTHALHGNEIRPFVREGANEETSFKSRSLPSWAMNSSLMRASSEAADDIMQALAYDRNVLEKCVQGQPHVIRFQYARRDREKGSLP